MYVHARMSLHNPLYSVKQILAHYTLVSWLNPIIQALYNCLKLSDHAGKDQIEKGSEDKSCTMAVAGRIQVKLIHIHLCIAITTHPFTARL